MNVAQLFGGILAAKDTAVAAVDLIGRGKVFEAQAMMLAQGKSLIDLANAAGEIKAENERLKDEIREMRAMQDLTAKIRRRAGLVYLAEPPPDREEGPHCPVCWENDKRLHALAKGGAFPRHAYRIYCPNCDRGFDPPA